MAPVGYCIVDGSLSQIVGVFFVGWGKGGFCVEEICIQVMAQIFTELETPQDSLLSDWRVSLSVPLLQQTQIWSSSSTCGACHRGFEYQPGFHAPVGMRCRHGQIQKGTKLRQDQGRNFVASVASGLGLDVLLQCPHRTH